MTAYRVLVTVLTVLVVAGMVWDQIHLKRMTRAKWPLAGVILAVVLASVWA